MRTRILVATAACLLLVGVTASTAAAQDTVGHDPMAPAHGGFTVTPPTSGYVMAFHTCSTNCEDPSQHLVRLAQSSDGTSWSDVAGWQAYKGSVPDVFRRGSTLYVTGAGLTKIDLTNGMATATRLVVKRSGGGNEMSRDVSFAGQLPDGRLAIAYVPSMQEVAGAAEIPILMAVEDVGSDGSAYTSVGAVISIPISSLPVRGEPTDPDVFFNGSEWILYVSVGANLIAYRSSSMLGPYALATQQVVSREAGGVPAGIVGAGGVWTFVNFGPSRNSIEIRRAVSVDGLSGLSAFTTVLTGSPYGATTAESPGITANTPGIACGAGCAATTADSSGSSSATRGVKPGARCTKAGAKATYQGRTLTCTRAKGRLVWR